MKDSWRESPQAIEELEQEGEVLVTRTTKDQQMRMVFWNEIKPVEGTGGKPVDQGTDISYLLAEVYPFNVGVLNVQSSRICGMV